MKNIILFIVIVLLVPVVAQENHSHNYFEMGRKKIERLEKVKLIEELNLTEESAIKLLVRRKNLYTKTFSYQAEKDSIRAILKTVIGKNNDQIIHLIEKSYKLEKDMIEEREKFLFGLKDILSVEQIGKYVIFEHNFREEIRKMFIPNNEKRSQKNRKK